MKGTHIFLISLAAIAGIGTYLLNRKQDAQSFFSERSHAVDAGAAVGTGNAAGRAILAQQTPQPKPNAPAPMSASPQPQLQGMQTQPTGNEPASTLAPTTDPTPAAGEQPAPREDRNASADAPRQQAVDETALRYFAREGDTVRLNAEIARLKALYPGWTPPANPLAVPQNGDKQLDAMWTLYAKGSYAQVRKAIADRQAAEPNWTPPKDLLDRLSVAEARERLVNASNLKQYQTVVRVGSENPSLLTCADVDVLWRVAEAFAHTQRQDRAKDAYSYILKNCSNPKERLATVEKAIPLLPEASVKDLFAYERQGADGKGEFEAARSDLVRHDVSVVQNDPKQSATPDDLNQLEAIANHDGKESDDRLLGWYFLRHGDAAKAADWFSKAHAKKDSAEVAQGLALADIGLGKPAEAESTLYPWRDTNTDIRKVYLAAVANFLALKPPPTIDPSILQRMAAEVAVAKDAAAAQQFGWYARAFNQNETAGKWFSSALRWKPDDEPSAYGLALTRLQLHDEAGVRELQRVWQGRSVRIAQLGERRSLAPRSGQAAPGAPLAEERPRAAPSIAARSPTVAGGGPLVRRGSCAGTDLYSRQTGAAAGARGWCLLDLNRPKEAVLAFEDGMRGANQTTRREAAWGESLAYLRSGMTDQAAVAAAKEPQPADRIRLLQASILSQRASNFFEAGRYNEALLALDQRARIAPERLDLLTLRGYAYLKLRRFDDAYRVFKALAASGDEDGIKGMGAVRASTEAE